MIRRAFLQMLGFSPLASFVPKQESDKPDVVLGPDWHEYRVHSELCLERCRTRQVATEKAFFCLLAVGFKAMELEQVRKDIAKCKLITKEHRHRFYGAFYDLMSDGKIYSNLSSHRMWDAIVVTFKTGDDGFLMLDIEPLKEQMSG